MSKRNLTAKKDEFALSRKLFIVESLLEYFITLLVSGAYLAKLTTTIGISDGMTAILSELTAFSSIFQLISIYLAHKTPVKRWLVPLMTLTQLLFASVYLIPLLDLKLSSSLIFFVVILLARMLASISSPAAFNMMLSLVETSKRGRYTSINNITSYIGSIFFTFGVSYLLDRFEEAGNMDAAFLTFSIIIFVLVVLHTLSLVFIKEKNDIPKENNTSPFNSVKVLLFSKEYRKLLISCALFAVASALTTPFLGTYQINELDFSMTLISVMDIIMTVITVFVLNFFGKHSTRTSYSSLISLSHFFFLFAYVCIIFATPSYGIIFFFGYRLAFLLGTSARAVSVTTLVFSLASPEDRTSALAINTIVTGVLGFFATLAATPFVNYVQAKGNTFFGFTVYAQQILAAVTAILILIVIFHFKFGCRNCLENAEKTMK